MASDFVPVPDGSDIFVPAVDLDLAGEEPEPMMKTTGTDDADGKKNRTKKVQGTGDPSNKKTVT